ncbi:tetratricopeptide repeat protein [Inconstantimicrobium mannanitabidum]|uniref:Uncharacterized protein n=1 Tax=Inconstantimicrobium mannanitabidum TaxID=1604901 RepID=A0ACB5RF81_9CLOT|nr:tetratricopeptide repeat protein [Clostridium sp. TW13]GKX67519.1 hypothetical protein rsdtw13_27770 [Clostridium sp. TW13]
MNFEDDNKIKKAEEIETSETFLNHYNWENIKQESRYINDLEEVKTEALGFQEEVEEFISKVQVIYNDFFSRINIGNWRGLLKSEAVWSMGDRQLLNSIMLEFLMTNHYLPQEVWKLLEDNFNWNEQKQYLYECYPKEFVDYLFKQINNNNGLRYCFLNEKLGCDYEKFLQYREAAFEALENNDFEYASKCIDNAYDIYENDPDLLLMRGKYYLHMGDVEKSLYIFENILQLDQEDIYAHFYRSKILYDKGQIHIALNDCKFLEEHNYNSSEFLLLYAKCCFKSNDFNKAKKLLTQISATDPITKAEVYTLIRKINLQFANELREKLRYDKRNKTIKSELDKLYRELGMLDSNQVRKKILFKLLGRVCICLFILVSQAIIVYAAAESAGFKNFTFFRSIQQFIMFNDEDHLIKNSADINNLPVDVSAVHGKVTNAAFLDMYRIPKKNKNNQVSFSYFSSKKAHAKGVFDKMNGYVCIGSIGDKKVIMIVDYDEAEKIYETKTLDFKGVLHKMPEDDLLTDVIKGKELYKYRKSIVTDKYIDTKVSIPGIRKMVMIMMMVMLLTQVLIIIQGLISSYLLIKNNRKGLSK